MKQQYGKSLWRQICKAKHYYILLAPFLVLFFLFTLLPVLMSVIVGFTSYDMLNTPNFVGLENYIRLFMDDDVFLIALKNTLIFACITGPIGYILCFLFAWLINELKPLWRTIVTVLFYAPALSGQAYMIWLFIFSNDRYGIVNGFLLNFGIINEPVNWLSDAATVMGVLVVVQLWMSLGTGFLAFIAGLKGTDRALYEAGQIDGIRNRFQELWYITLPQMGSQLLFGAVMQIVSAFSVADISISLAGFPSTEYAAETIVTHIMDYGTTRFELGYASAMATVLFMLMYFSNKAVGRLLKNIGR